MDTKNTYIAIIGLLLIATLAVGSATATTWTVDASGGNTCTTATPSCTTIQAAVNAATIGDTISIAAGDYPENIVLNNFNGLTITGAGNTTIVDPASGIGFAITDSADITIENLKIHTTGENAHGIWVAGTPDSGTGMDGLTVQDTAIIVDGYSSGIYAEQTSTPHTNWLIDSNAITINDGTGGTGDGMDLYDVSGSTVSHNTITLNNPTSSTNVLWTAELSDISGLTFTDNVISGSSGSMVAFLTNFVDTTADHNIDTVTVSGNTFSDWGARALKFAPASGAGSVSGITVSDNTFQMTTDTQVIGGSDAASATGSGNTFKVTAPATIQDAIDSAHAGDTIDVASGTYTENVNVNNAITLDGPNANVDPNTQTRSAEATIDGQITVSSDGVAINGFTITNPSGKEGVYAADHSDIAITDNIVSDIGTADTSTSGTNFGIGIVSSTAAVDNVKIADNKIDTIAGGTDKSGDAIAIGWSSGTQDVTNLVITGNAISNVTSDGTHDYSNGGRGAYGIMINHGLYGGQTIGAQITDNTISNLDGLWAHAIGLEGDTPNAVVTGNIISALTDQKTPSDAAGIRFEDNPSTDTVTVKHNDIDTTTVSLGISNDASGTADAANNYWGTSTPDSTSFLGDVTYSPWCTDSDCTTYGPVMLTHGSATSGYTSLHGALTAASANDRIDIMAGTYSEPCLVVSKSGLTIVGAGAASTTIDGSACTSSSSGDFFEVDADGLTLKDLTIDGKVPQYTAWPPAKPYYGLYLSGAHPAKLQDLIVKRFGKSGVNMNGAQGVTVDNVTSNDNGGAGFFVQDSHDISFNGVTTDNNQWGGIGIGTWGRYHTLGTDGITFTGTNSFGENAGYQGGIYLEMGNYNDKSNPKPITYSTDGSSADVQLESGDFHYILTGPQDDGNASAGQDGYERIRFYDTALHALAAEAHPDDALHIIGPGHFLAPDTRNVTSLDAHADFGTSGLSGMIHADKEFNFAVTVGNVSGIPDLIRYKAVLTYANGTPVADQVVYYPDAGDNPANRSTWANFITDGNGVAYFGPSTGFHVSSVPNLTSSAGVTTPFAATMSSGTYDLSVGIVVAGTDFELASMPAVQFTVFGAHQVPPGHALNSTNDEVVIAPGINNTDIKIPDGVDHARMDVRALLTNGSATLPSALTVHGNHHTDVTVQLASNTVITGARGWDGTINLPSVSTKYTLPSVPGKQEVGRREIEIGAGDTPINLSHAARLSFGKSATFVGWSQNGQFHEITTTCVQDSQSWADANLPAGGDCRYVSSSGDLFVWTKHFTTFVTYDEQNIPSPAGGGGGGSGSAFTQSAPTQPSTNAQPAPAQQPTQPTQPSKPTTTKTTAQQPTQKAPSAPQKTQKAPAQQSSATGLVAAQGSTSVPAWIGYAAAILLALGLVMGFVSYRRRRR